MRKLLAGFLATAMVASIATTMSFAANNSAHIVKDNAYSTAGAFKFARLTIDPDAVANADDIVVETSIDANLTTTSAVDLAKMLDNTKFDDVTIDGKVYNLVLKQVGSTEKLSLNFNPATAVSGLATTSKVALQISVDGTTWVDVWASGLISTFDAGSTLGAGGETADAEKGGAFETAKVNVSDVVLSYSDGSPIPLTEDPVGVDKALNTNGGVQSGKTLYFKIRDDNNAAAQKMGDDLYWKLKISKGDNGKYIKELSDVTKTFSSKLFDANTGSPVSNTGEDGKRHRYIKVKLNDIFTDDEYKISLDLRLSPTTKAVDTKVAASDDTQIKVKDFTFYVKNIIKGADNDWKVGVGGLMLEPLENDWNNVTWYDEDGDLAHLKFFADSDVDKFFSKLSTKWDNVDYASYFNDQDAFRFEFTGAPNLSATSRADLEIYSPFVDEDGNDTIDPATAVIYQVIDGDLIDVSDAFEYKETENGDMAYVARTRFLGTYVICEKAVEEASDEVAPDDLTPDDETTPNTNGGDKAPANTGRNV